MYAQAVLKRNKPLYFYVLDALQHTREIQG
jgi:hypothetical protein